MSYEFAFFGNIQGLDSRIGLRTRYDILIEAMGEPHTRETIVLSNGSELITLNYDGINFTIRNNRVDEFKITGEQYRLGGRRRIGIGSTRSQVEEDLQRRQGANRLTADCSCSRLRSGISSDGGIHYSLYNISVAFVFDQDDIVTLMWFRGGP